jgi:hypothetical protein
MTHRNGVGFDVGRSSGGRPSVSIEMIVDSWSTWKDVFRICRLLVCMWVTKQDSRHPSNRVQNQAMAGDVVITRPGLEDIPTSGSQAFV